MSAYNLILVLWIIFCVKNKKGDHPKSIFYGRWRFELGKSHTMIYPTTIHHIKEISWWIGSVHMNHIPPLFPPALYHANIIIHHSFHRTSLTSITHEFHMRNVWGNFFNDFLFVLLYVVYWFVFKVHYNTYISYRLMINILSLKKVKRW